MLNQPTDKYYTEVSYSESSAKTTLKWEEVTSGPQRDEHKVKTPMPPHPDMHEVLQALTPWFCDVLEFGEEWLSDWIVIGVKLKYDGGIPEMAVTGKREIHTGDTVSQTTPYLPPSGNAPAVLEALFEEAEKHLNGKRAQGELFAGPGGSDAEDGALSGAA
jgi:hypothetical protein